MHKKIFMAASLFGAAAVGIGAFGSHALKGHLPVQDIAVFNTGVQYHFYHVLALFFTGVLYRSYGHKLLGTAAYCFGLGIVFFSFSLYAVKLSGLLSGGEVMWLNYLTPLGGVFFILGWVLIATYFFKDRVKVKPTTS